MQAYFWGGVLISLIIAGVYLIRIGKNSAIGEVIQDEAKARRDARKSRNSLGDYGKRKRLREFFR